MTHVLSRLLSFAGRHWLRLLIVGCALVLFSRKQVNFNIRLGAPAPAEMSLPSPEASAGPQLQLSEDVAAAEKKGLFSRFNLFRTGSDEPTLYDHLNRLNEAEVTAFIRRFSNVAQAEQEKFGIPASITLANGLLHTRAGTNNVAQSANNFFALPCGADWPGTSVRANGKCIRTYESAWTSFRDHSLYLTSGNFAALTQFNKTDYRRWAAGMEELGFNDTEDLAAQLLRTIDRYQLFQFD
ncbi:glucosaminidase domain-containing protein [Neolewinella lacunae]|uniref:Glucosaminidase domain-containing protein n=1 Tax=Neolewinella lacunae TaxID=1517758 RepID=A0A923PI10_9BACT|nr:glucosaminidase domain-containing protein [Neolewinella lacunae]MBC6994455.1 glucosaminidase domain-containing protein [Neolewinella lacunae]MDN3634252.1 glucosaminidase domain-containing protein [Neolewinella lacunae]